MEQNGPENHYFFVSNTEIQCTFDSISFMFKFTSVVNLRRKILFVTNPFITFMIKVYETLSYKLSMIFPCSLF